MTQLAFNEKERDECKMSAVDEVLRDAMSNRRSRVQRKWLVGTWLTMYSMTRVMSGQQSKIKISTASVMRG